MTNMFSDPGQQKNSNRQDEPLSGFDSTEENEELTEEDFDFEGEEDGDFESSDWENDNYDSYGTSGEKYGWYNGWSDDVIDDAFEGDPANTWNVD